MTRRTRLPTLISAPGPRRRTTTSATASIPLGSTVSGPCEPTAFASPRSQRRSDPGVVPTFVPRKISCRDAQRDQRRSDPGLGSTFMPPLLSEEYGMDADSLAAIKLLLEEDRRNNIPEEISDIEFSDDELSYEECLEIGEALGDVKKDEWANRAESEINKLSVELFDAATHSDDADECKCLVCLQQYEGEEALRKLPCGHAFHICCADQWLLQTNACPCCRKPIDETC